MYSSCAEYKYVHSQLFILVESIKVYCSVSCFYDVIGHTTFYKRNVL
jgi:hypothetical protein